MVAYSFKKRFGPSILAGTKAQTIRSDRKRHARLGEEVQLYTGMRTKHCRLLGRPTCLGVMPVRFCFSKRGAAEMFQVDGLYLTLYAMEAFAKANGFAGVADMAAFWWAEHPQEGSNVLTFEGILITWKPLVTADSLNLEAAA